MLSFSNNDPNRAECEISPLATESQDSTPLEMTDLSTDRLLAANYSGHPEVTPISRTPELSAGSEKTTRPDTASYFGLPTSDHRNAPCFAEDSENTNRNIESQETFGKWE